MYAFNSNATTTDNALQRALWAVEQAGGVAVRRACGK